MFLSCLQLHGYLLRRFFLVPFVSSPFNVYALISLCTCHVSVRSIRLATVLCCLVVSLHSRSAWSLNSGGISGGYLWKTEGIIRELYKAAFIAYRGSETKAHEIRNSSRVLPIDIPEGNLNSCREIWQSYNYADGMIDFRSDGASKHQENADTAYRGT